MRLLLLILFLAFINNSEAQTTVEGRYMGFNLYVQNPWDDSNDFCLDSIIINGVKYSDEINLSAFEIKLDSLNFDLEDPLEISIYHKHGCKPKILNQNHHYQRSTLAVTDFSIENDVVKWTANERIPGRFELQVYRWNRWVIIDSLPKTIKDSVFEIALENDLHSGENQLRVRFINVRGKSFYSKEIKHQSGLEETNYTIDKKTKILSFTTINHFELYDQYGSRILRGKSDKIDLQLYRDKKYYLNFDNQNVELKLN